MDIRINNIDPFYDDGISWVRADVEFRFRATPEYPYYPQSPPPTVTTLVILKGNPNETFGAFQTRALQAAYAILERVVSDRQTVVPQRPPPQ